MTEVARQSDVPSSREQQQTTGGPLRASSTRSAASSARAHSSAREPSSGYTLDDDVYDEEAEYEGDDGEDDDDEGGAAIEEGGSADGGRELMNETTVKSGYLYKRGEKRKNWKKRWFVLRSAKLYYYKNEKEYQLLRFIDMTEVHTIAAVSLKKAEHCFGISTSKRQYYVRASNAKEMQSWVDALRDVREQVRQRSTITRDLASLDVGGAVGGASSGGEQPTPTVATAGPSHRATSSNSPNLVPVDRSGSIPATKTAGAAPISIMIPGKGLYTSPAQPRATAGGSVISPLSYTSDSEAGGQGGVEQFGLSYASSAGQSMASSPGRSGVLHQLPSTTAPGAHHQDYSSAGTNSPHSHSGGDDANDGHQRKSRTPRRASGFREPSAGSSVGNEEGGGAPSASAVGAAPAAPLQRRNSSQHPQILSSSEEEGDGDEWDEDEEADRAMPLPSTGGLGLGLGHAGHGTAGAAPPQQQAQSSKQASQSDTSAATKPKVGPEFFKDASKVIHQGYLMKQSSRRKHWRKRWFVLTSSTLSYTRSHMDGKAHRQIPLSSILDAIEYTSKKSALQSAPLSPSLSAFGGSGFFGSQAPERRNTTMQGKQPAGAGSSASVTPATIAATTTAEGDGSTAAAGAVSGGEGDGPSASAEKKVSVAPRQPTAAGVRAEERQQNLPASTTTPKRKMENCFKIITPKRVFIVCAPTEEEELKWLSALQALLAHYHENDQGDATGKAAAAEQHSMQSPSREGGAVLPDLQQAQQQQQASQSVTVHNAASLSSSTTSTSLAARLQPPSISLSKPKPSQSQDEAHFDAAAAAAAAAPASSTVDDVKST